MKALFEYQSGQMIAVDSNGSLIFLDRSTKIIGQIEGSSKHYLGMQALPDFDFEKKPLIALRDSAGVNIINLKTKEQKRVWESPYNGPFIVAKEDEVYNLYLIEGQETMIRCCIIDLSQMEGQWPSIKVFAIFTHECINIILNILSQPQSVCLLYVAAHVYVLYSYL